MIYTRRSGSDCKDEKASGKSDIFEKIPEHVPAGALSFQAEV